MRVHGGGPRGRHESDERGGKGKEGEEGGRLPATTSAAAAIDGDGRRARGGNARQAAGARKDVRHGVDASLAVRRDRTIAVAVSAAGQATAAAAAAGAPPTTSNPDRQTPLAESGASKAAWAASLPRVATRRMTATAAGAASGGGGGGGGSGVGGR